MFAYLYGGGRMRGRGHVQLDRLLLVTVERGAGGKRAELELELEELELT